MKRTTLIPIILAFTAIFLFTYCTRDDDGTGERGTLLLKITDAPSDDENISGIFITISEIRINDKPVRSFKPQTIEISALNNGKTKLLLDRELASKQYRQITLVLDKVNDDAGKSPGNYVLTNDNKKHDLFRRSASSGKFELFQDFGILTGSKTSLVIDFDLRKAVVYEKEEAAGTYSFVSDEEFRHAIRIADEEKTGTIWGNLTAGGKTHDQIFVLLYRKGEFDEVAETSGKTPGRILFPNAVSSALVEPNGEYRLCFIKEGDYELKVAAFRKMGDKHQFSKFLRTTSRRTRTRVNDVKVSAGSELQLNIEVFTLF